jgi:hypothetical protein
LEAAVKKDIEVNITWEEQEPKELIEGIESGIRNFLTRDPSKPYSLHIGTGENYVTIKVYKDEGGS